MWYTLLNGNYKNIEFIALAQKNAQYSLEKLKLNETPVRTSRNFHINNIALWI